jgi:N-acyl-D-aspartate/D-glutamate deacylase
VAATLITNVSIFDGTGAPLFPGEVLVEEGRITGVARGGDGSRRRARQSSMAAGVRCCPG